MGKKKDEKWKIARTKSSSRAEEGGAARSNNYRCLGGGGGGGNNDKYAVYDFTEDDMRTEIESRKTLAKYGPKSPSRKPVHHRPAVDKYDFLELCKFLRVIVCHL